MPELQTLLTPDGPFTLFGYLADLERRIVALEQAVGPVEDEQPIQSPPAS